jgi:hypothetical protein
MEVLSTTDVLYQINEASPFSGDQDSNINPEESHAIKLLLYSSVSSGKFHASTSN